MWLWSRLIPQHAEHEWMQRLNGVPNCVFTTLPGHMRMRIECFSRQFAVVGALLAAYGGKVTCPEDKDWVAASAESSIPPLFIRNRLIICADEAEAAAMRAKYRQRNVLYFPAECAFGTGHHATTSTCLRLLCDEARVRRAAPWRIIDAGCGSGILALAALRLGAASAVAFDFDPVAVQIAQRNVERNGGAAGLSLFQADVFEWSPSPEQCAHVVVANLFSEVLRRAFPRLRNYFIPGVDGVLLISGILRDQAPATLKSAQDAGFSHVRSITHSKWVTMKLTI